MHLGDILVAHGLITSDDIEAALRRQQSSGGLLAENLVALGRLSTADLERVLHAVPSAPKTILETGIGLSDLLNLLTKVMYANGIETPSAMSEALKLPRRTIQELIEQAQERKLFDVLGALLALPLYLNCVMP